MPKEVIRNEETKEPFDSYRFKASSEAAKKTRKEIKTLTAS